MENRLKMEESESGNIAGDKWGGFFPRRGMAHGLEG